MKLRVAAAMQYLCSPQERVVWMVLQSLLKLSGVKLNNVSR